MMKKLFLTSFSFRTGEKVFDEQRLVMVQSNELCDGSDYESIAYQKMQKWFPENHPESMLLSIVAHPTITGYAEDNVIRNENKEAFKLVDNVFDASWYNYSNHPKESGFMAGFSDDVLIDTDGNRKNFIIGWFDSDENEWKTADEQEIEPTMTWQYLQLAKYDKS